MSRCGRFGSFMSGVLGLWILGMGLVGCGSDAPPNLLIISVDTLRWDVLQTYSTRIPTPLTRNIDRLAEQSLVLDKCYTVSPRTTQSFASLMTGLYPSHHGAFGLFHDLPDSARTLAEMLKERGYRNLAVVTNHFLQSGRGWEQGFDVYDDYLYRHRLEIAQEVTGRVDLLTLEPPDGPFFMWVHFLDPHWPYDPPPELLFKLHEDFDYPSFRVHADLDSGVVTRGQVIFENDLDQETRRHMQRRYLGEVLYTDGNVGHLMGMLEQRGYLENTIVLFYSDHGESLGEHDYFYAHGEKLYEPTVRIPAFIHFPGQVEPGRYGGLVSTPDITAALMELLQLPTSDHLDGVSFLEAARTDGEPPRDAVYLESDYQFIHQENPEFFVEGPLGKWRGIIAGSYKLIRIPNPDDTDIWELYDLQNDPGETRNLVDERPEVVSALKTELARWDALVDRQVELGGNIDEETLERIRSLGYIN